MIQHSSFRLPAGPEVRRPDLPMFGWLIASVDRRWPSDMIAGSADCGDQALHCGVGGWAPGGLAAGAAVHAGIADEDTADDARHCPAAGTAHGGGVHSRPVGRLEVADGVLRQQEPHGGEVVCRVPGAEVAEVDYAADGAVGGQDAGRVQVGVQP